MKDKCKDKEKGEMRKAGKKMAWKVKMVTMKRKDSNLDEAFLFAAS